MSDNCKPADCQSCNSDCGDRKGEPIPKEAMLNGSKVKKTIGIISGKGGVGKSLVTSLCASSMAKAGHKVGILDGDITGPSIPKIFGINETIYANKEGHLLPAMTKAGTKMVSINLMLEDPSDPVVWRGPIIGDIVKQFWNTVDWGELDYMFIDMPPGTGDVALTVFQSIPIDGIIIVTTPQDLVSMIVEKAVKMANMMNIPVLGLVENMSYLQCSSCNEKMSIFGDSKLEKTASEMKLTPIAALPIDPEIAKFCDSGNIEGFEKPWLKELRESLKKVL